MGKNKKRVLSDSVHVKKGEKKMNPFEVHVNKEKLKVIGKKQKNDRGLPGISRAKAIQKRKSTLLEEYKVQNKNNKFVDRRIGEKGLMNIEEKAMARFAAVKIKAHNKKNIFNLAEDEILTHKGQTLSEIEKFDDPRSDDEDFSDNENKTGNLESNFIKEAHFGGGLFTNTGKEGAMTHKDLINQLIIESKKKKLEKQKLKEATLELTEKLDTEWKDLIPLVNKNNDHKVEEEKRQLEDYDKVMRELKFEKRGTVSDKLKTEDEIAKVEKECLEELERERIKRMYNNEDEKPKRYHRSADDLDDGFAYSSDEDNTEENILSYNTQGESNVDIYAQRNGTIIKSNNMKETTENQNSEDEKVEEESSDEELETDSEDNLSDLKQEESESEAEDTKNLSENDEDNDTDKESKNGTVKNKVVKESDNNGANKDNPPLKMSKSKEEKTRNEIKSVENTIDFSKTVFDASNDNATETNNIPFTFSLPESYQSLLNILEMYDNYEDIVIQRMIKCNHPSLSEKNKGRLNLLFAYLLQLLNDLFSEDMDKETIKKNFGTFQRLVPHIYELAKLNPDNAHQSILEVIKEKFDDYRKKPKTYPGLEVLVFLKLVSVLFPTSDFRHQIVTPCFIFMELILSKCRITNCQSIAYGLFVSSLSLEYLTLSKRYFPAVINYLAGLLHMAIPKTGVKLIKILPPFKSTYTHLVLIENYSMESFKSLKLDTTDFCEMEIGGKFQVKVLYNVVKLLGKFFEQYKCLPSHAEIFEKVLTFLELIPLDNYPKVVQDSLVNLVECLKKSNKEKVLEYLVLENSKPKALRLYEPKVQVIYDGKQHKNQSKEKAQYNKLVHKLKREKKGALREIRRDNAFLGRVKINRQIQSDMERKEKVKRIYSEAALQQSELNEIDRKKKKKH